MTPNKKTRRIYVSATHEIDKASVGFTCIISMAHSVEYNDFEQNS
jgi:hypothetical protein